MAPYVSVGLHLNRVIMPGRGLRYSLADKIKVPCFMLSQILHYITVKPFNEVKERGVLLRMVSAYILITNNMIA